MTEKGEGFNVPIWMTEASAADLRHEKQPWLHVTALFEIIGLIDKRLESIRVNKDNLPSDQTKENPSEPQPTPIIIDTGSQARKPASTGKRSQRDCGSRGKNAAASRQRRRRHKGGS